MATVEERVVDIVSEQLGVDKDKITPETSFVNDLGADSLDTVELVMELMVAEPLTTCQSITGNGITWPD